MKPLVSVILPVYNTSKYLEKCVISLMSQSYDNIEVLLINDGSTDDSLNLCKKLANQFNNVFFFSKKNEGLGLTRNYGMVHSNGEYILFIDSDDYLKGNLIEELVLKSLENELDICKAGFTKVNEADEVLFQQHYSEESFENEDVYFNFFSRMLGSDIKNQDVIGMSVWATLYKKSILEDNNIQFISERELISEDLIFNYKVCKVAKRAMLINNCDYCYLFNTTSLTTSYKKDKFLNVKKMFEYLMPQLENVTMQQRFTKYFFINLLVCFQQEKNKHSRETAMKNIKKICECSYTQLLIKQYPINKLPLKQMVFVYCIKFKLVKLLYKLI